LLPSIKGSLNLPVYPNTDQNAITIPCCASCHGGRRLTEISGFAGAQYSSPDAEADQAGEKANPPEHHLWRNEKAKDGAYRVRTRDKRYDKKVSDRNCTPKKQRSPSDG
jgi:hypothetical protein